MAEALYSTADYQAALLLLMPQGRVWPKALDGIQGQFAAGLAPTFERNDQRAQQLLEDAFPPKTDELLPEWEASLGLPDPCAGESPTVQQRQAQVVARFTDTGGQSTSRYIALATQLGFDVSITTFAPFRAGRSRAGDPCNGAEWVHTWRVNAPLNTLTRFRAGASRAGEALAVWSNAVLECELRARAPAHAVVQFAYALIGELDLSQAAQSFWLGAVF